MLIFNIVVLLREQAQNGGSKLTAHHTTIIGSKLIVLCSNNGGSEPIVHTTTMIGSKHNQV